MPGVTDFLISNPTSLTIFEVGFGTGLNFLLLLYHVLGKQYSFPIHFYSVEAFPIDVHTAKKLNYGSILQNPELGKALIPIFDQLKAGENHSIPFPQRDIHLHLFIQPFSKIESIKHATDFIFHDPFSPKVNHELWTVDTFLKLSSFSTPNAVLSTYCAASKARAAMAKAGWYVAKTRGALGKREMTVAFKSGSLLSSFKRVNETGLFERWDKNEFANDH